MLTLEATPAGTLLQRLGPTDPPTGCCPFTAGRIRTRARTRILPSHYRTLAALLCTLVLAALPVALAEDNPEKPPAVAGELALARATMCEEIQDFEPYNPSITFSIARGKVSCYTLFDPVPDKAVIYHRWYHRDQLSTRKRLLLKPPRWATFSTILLRQSDMGPWQVVVSDENDQILQRLRFSVTE